MKRTATIQLDAEILPHAPYSPDLAPCDFALFPDLKKQLKGKRFSDFDELQTTARALLYSYSSDWFHRAFQAWVEQHRRCVEVNGEYFEKE